MSNTLQITLTEKQILKSFIDHPELLVEDDMFITEVGKEFQYILLSLQDEGMSFIPEHILKNALEHVTEKSVQAILGTEYQLDKVPYYIEELNTCEKVQGLQTKVLRELTIELNKKNSDVEALQGIHNEFGLILDSINTKSVKPMTFGEALEKHEPTVAERANQKIQTSGCYLFDKVMPNIVPGLCTLAGFSGSMKTTYMLYLAKQRIAKRLPTAYINTELAFSGWMDNTISSMIKEPYYDILGMSHEDVSMIDFNAILEKYGTLTERYMPHDKFLLFPKSSCTIQELKTFALYARKKMMLKDKTTLFLQLDLMSMLGDFSENKHATKADTIENGVNLVNEIGLSTNTLIIGTIQMKRIEPVRKIEREEDIEKFRPTLAGLKSSGAWEERSRWVFALHNPYHIVHKTPCNPIIRESTDPILDLTSLKDTYTGKTGTTIQYYFNANYKSLNPYEATDNE